MALGEAPIKRSDLSGRLRHAKFFIWRFSQGACLLFAGSGVPEIFLIDVCLRERIPCCGFSRVRFLSAGGCGTQKRFQLLLKAQLLFADGCAMHKDFVPKYYSQGHGSSLRAVAPSFRISHMGPAGGA